MLNNIDITSQISQRMWGKSGDLRSPTFLIGVPGKYHRFPLIVRLLPGKPTLDFWGTIVAVYPHVCFNPSSILSVDNGFFGKILRLFPISGI